MGSFTDANSVTHLFTFTSAVDAEIEAMFQPPVTVGTGTSNLTIAVDVATGHPQTNESNGLYLSLVTLQKRISGRGPGAPLQEFAPELAQLAVMCQGKLEPLKALLDEAAGIARGGGRGNRA